MFSDLDSSVLISGKREVVLDEVVGHTLCRPGERERKRGATSSGLLG